MACRTGCKTKDHESYAECLQDANVRPAQTMNSPKSFMWDATKKDLPAYANARANGIQPGGTNIRKVREAEAASKAMGVPYDANTMPPAHMIVNKNAARFVKSEA